MRSRFYGKAGERRQYRTEARNDAMGGRRRVRRIMAAEYY